MKKGLPMKGHVKIVIPCTNEGEWLRLTVESILEHTRGPSFEVFILANGDQVTDFSFLERPAFRRTVKLERIEERLGVGNSINRAVAVGDAEYYVFLDAHCLQEQPDWLEQAIDCLESFPRASMVQPEVVHFSYRDEIRPGETLDLARVVDLGFEYSIRWAWPYEKPLEVSEVQTTSPSRTPHESMAGGGMAVFARSETFHRLGGYDPEVAGWYPETSDYCCRAWLLGRPMMVDPSVRVRHLRKVEGRGEARRPFDIIHGVLRTVYKYFSPRRRALAETLFRKHGLSAEVEMAIQRIHQGRWLEERAASLRERVHDDDWLFDRFRVYEERL